jgi:methyl-accepting chemotaxis protein
MLNRFRLKTILVCGAVLFAIVPAAVLSIGSAIAVRALVMSGDMEEGETLALGLASQYEQFLDLYTRMVTTTATHAAAVQPFNAAGLNPILARTRANYPATSAVLIVDPSGRSIAYDPPTTAEGKSAIGIDFSDRAWFREVVQSKRAFVEKSAIIGRASRKPVVSIIGPIKDRSGRLKGVVVAGVSLEQIDAVASRIRHGQSGHAVVATAQGQALAHPEAGRVEKLDDFSKLAVWPLVTAKESGRLSSYTGTTGHPRLGGFATVPGVGWKIWVGRQLSEVEGDVLASYRQALAWGLLSLLGLVAAAVCLAVGISRPIEGLRAAAKSIAGGDLEQRAPEHGPQDVVMLARAFNQMAGSLREMIAAEREGKIRLERAVAEYGALAGRVARGELSARVPTNGEGELAQLGVSLNRMTEDLSNLVAEIQTAGQAIVTATAEILAATAQQAAGVAEEATAIQETSTTVDEVKQTARVVSQKTKAVVEAAEQNAEVARDGQRAAEEGVRGIQETKVRMEVLAERILSLSEQAQTIGEIITTVNELAEQSNLLAVNAAIEAAKAGEAGKGFAVVAAEVKALAEQSKQATGQVRGILQEIQRATQAAVMAAEHSVRAAESGVTVAGKAGEAIRVLAQGVTDSTQAAQQILASTRQQAVGMDQVALAMQNIQQASAQNMASTRQVERAAQDLNTLANRLTALVAGQKPALAPSDRPGR